jgi:hypothetical protein
MPYGTYGASIDFGTGGFSNGIAANPCTYASYDAAGNIINTGSFNSYSQASPQAEIDRNTTLFRTSGCTPWALIAPAALKSSPNWFARGTDQHGGAPAFPDPGLGKLVGRGRSLLALAKPD